MKKTTAMLGFCVALLGAAMAISPRTGVSGPPGPKFSVDIEAFCGSPSAINPETGLPFDELHMDTFNVAVVLSDESDDNGPAESGIDKLEVVCTAAVKTGRGKPDHQEFGYKMYVAPALFEESPFLFNCALDAAPVGATEWKATVTATDADLRTRMDSCEEVPLP